MLCVACFDWHVSSYIWLCFDPCFDLRTVLQPPVRQEACQGLYKLCLGRSSDGETGYSFLRPILASLLVSVQEAQSMKSAKRVGVMDRATALVKLRFRCQVTVHRASELRHFWGETEQRRHCENGETICAVAECHCRYDIHEDVCQLPVFLAYQCGDFKWFLLIINHYVEPHWFVALMFWSFRKYVPIRKNYLYCSILIWRMQSIFL